MATNFQWAKLGINSLPKIIAAWASIVAILGTFGYNAFSYVNYEPEIPPEALEKAAELQIKRMNEITLPPKPMPERVIVTHEPHDHKALEDRVKDLEAFHP